MARKDRIVFVSTMELNNIPYYCELLNDEFIRGVLEFIFSYQNVQLLTLGSINI